MCLAVPGKVIERHGDDALVDFAGSRVRVSLALTPDASAGDWVLVHAGFAISELDERRALETWEYLNVSSEEEAQELSEAIGGFEE